MIKSKPYIYKKTIKCTGISYIGKHNGSKGMSYIGGGIKYKQDYKIYVKNRQDDLIEEILEYVDDISKIHEREEYWLNLVDAKNNPLYYNLTNKCYGIEKHSKETCLKISQSNKGKKRSGEFKEIRRQQCTGLVQSKDTIKKRTDKTKGMKRSEISRRRISESNINKPKSINHRKSMSLAKLGKKSNHPEVPIIQYDLNMNQIKEWSSGRLAANFFNKTNSADITGCCKGRKKTAYGYIWKYKLNNNE